MKTSTKSRYALQFLLALAARYPNRPARVQETVEGQDLPLNYLHALVNVLKNAGVIRVRRGRGGGCELSRDADDITVLEIVEAMDGPFVQQAAAPGLPVPVRVIEWAMADAKKAYRNALSRVSLQDLVDLQREWSAGSEDYSI